MNLPEEAVLGDSTKPSAGLLHRDVATATALREPHSAPPPQGRGPHVWTAGREQPSLAEPGNDESSLPAFVPRDGRIGGHIDLEIPFWGGKFAPLKHSLAGPSPGPGADSSISGAAAAPQEQTAVVDDSVVEQHYLAAGECQAAEKCRQSAVSARLAYRQMSGIRRGTGNLRRGV